MSNQTLTLNDKIYEYILGVSLREVDVLKNLREETSQHKLARMQIAPEQGQFMAMIARLTNAKRYLEVGTFTGYSSTVMALTMPSDSEIICCDNNKEFTNVAKRYWNMAGVSDRITLHLDDAHKTLNAMISEGKINYFDLMFIDADKNNYDQYYELAKEYEISMVQLAQAFVNSRPFVTSNIIGATNMQQLKENIDSINTKLSKEILSEINQAQEKIPNPAP